MEEPNRSVNNLTPKPTKAPPPPAGLGVAGGGGAAVATTAASSARKRRKVGAPENVDLHVSKYVQIRTLLKDLRPAFIEILKTPDYRNSRHALEICKGMRTMMELCKQLRAETCLLGKNKRPLEGPPAAGESMDNQSNKRQKDDTPQETHIVGGSPIGWNFIMFLKIEKKATDVA